MVAIYGEGDVILASFLKRHKNIVRMGNREALTTVAYVGNMAWAHIVANQALRNNPDLGGEAYIITDDTPCMNGFDLMEKMGSERGNTVSEYSIPYWIVYLFVMLLYVVARIISPVYKLKVEFNPALLTYLGHSHTYQRKKAEKKLRFKPIFDFPSSLARSTKYYRNF